MLALAAAALLLLDAFGIDHLGQVDIFLLALACWAAHFALAVAIPWPRRQP
jgi:hypothetical protein